MYVDTFKYEPSLYYGPSSRDFDPQYEEDGTARPASKKSTGLHETVQTKYVANYEDDSRYIQDARILQKSFPHCFCYAW